MTELELSSITWLRATIKQVCGRAFAGGRQVRRGEKYKCGIIWHFSESPNSVYSVFYQNKCLDFWKLAFAWGSNMFSGGGMTQA